MNLAQTNTTTMPIWFWIIVFLLTALGIALGIWSFMSGFKSISKPKSNHQIDEILLTKKYSWTEVEQLPESTGLYIMFIGQKYNDKEFFIPIFIEKATNIKAEVLTLKKLIIEGKEKTLGAEITSYLMQKQLTAADINFYFIDVPKESLDEGLQKYLEATNAAKRGFKK
ncbi:hypothetical protein [Mesoplasma seiffertii]|uniref:hypothetical protein n=1 Tax=Mesoplasma seiffertii TaxID=28224 RepID=UPI00047AABCE|nr:hypothetical protein [Mesoplasma seiffertii]